MIQTVLIVWKPKVELLDDNQDFIMQTYSGQGQQYAKYALLKFAVHGKPLQLTVYKNLRLATLPQYQDYLFLPFTDKSNGSETYAGGRYIDLRTGDFKDGFVTLDFNKAYNPYCAFSDGYACPKPPDENNLEIEIKAGEKKYTGTKKQ